MQDILDKLGEIEARLANSSSDPKWLNDGLAEVRTAVENHVAPNPMEALLEKAFTGTGVGSMEFRDLASCHALTGFATNWSGWQTDVTETEALEAAKAELSRMANWSTLAGSYMASVRQARIAQQKAVAALAAAEAAKED